MKPRIPDIDAIRDSLRERYRQKVRAELPDDETSAVALTVIDTLLELTTEMLKQYDEALRDYLRAEMTMH